MGFFDNLFGGKSKEEQERDILFAKLSRYLNDDDAQMKTVLAAFRPMYDSTPMDKVPDGTGEFGRDPNNPIPCNGPLGEITYLSKLIAIKEDGTTRRFTFHRLGSREANGRNVDVYELIGYDAWAYDVLYLDMYHTTKSKLCPKGYKLQDKCTGLRGSNGKNTTFPFNQFEFVRDIVMKTIGVPIYDPQLKEFDEKMADDLVCACRELGEERFITSLKWW